MRLQQVHRLVGSHHGLAEVRHELLEVPVRRVYRVICVCRLDMAQELRFTADMIEEIHSFVQLPRIAQDLRLLEPDP